MKPVISEKEYSDRRKRIQDMMQMNGLDIVIAYSDDRFTYGQAHARWICNYIPQFESAFVIVPSKGPAIIATGAESEEYALTYAKGVEVRVVDIFLHPSEEYPYTTIMPFKKIVSELEDRIGKQIERVGIAGDEMIPHKLYDALRNGFETVVFADAEPMLMRLRSVKTTDEIAVIRYAYKIAQAGMNAAIEALEVGKTEREIAAIAEYKMRSMGSEGAGIMTMVASGKKHLKPILATTSQRVIEKNDMVCMTFAPRYEGYHGAIARPVVMGKPDAALQRAIDLSMQAQAETREVLRPGTLGCEVDAAARRTINAAGLGNHFVYTGVHSVGVVEFEWPIMTSLLKDPIRENMVLSIDIPLYLNDDFGGFRIENGFLITADGNTPLNDLSVIYTK